MSIKEKSSTQDFEDNLKLFHVKDSNIDVPQTMDVHNRLWP